MRATFRAVFLASVTAAFACACAAGCSSEVGGGASSSGSGGASSSGSGSSSSGVGGSIGAPCSVTGVTGTIPGVSLSVQSDRCTYHVGESAVFTYEVTTDASVPTIEIMASGGCGSCATPSSDPLSFVSFVINGTTTDGQDQSYCICDVGCCAPDQAAMIMVDAAKASGTIQWSGRNWGGPSDTGNPEGPFFGAGQYGVHLTFDGRAQGSVMATLPIEIVP